MIQQHAGKRHISDQDFDHRTYPLWLHYGSRLPRLRVRRSKAVPRATNKLLDGTLRDAERDEIQGLGTFGTGPAKKTRCTLVICAGYKRWKRHLQYSKCAANRLRPRF